MINPFAKNKYSNKKNKIDTLKAWHSELSDINKDNLTKAVSRFDLSNPQSYIYRNAEQPGSDLESGAYIDSLEKNLRWLDSSIEDIQQIRANIPKAIRILLAPGGKNSGRRKWDYHSIKSLSEETLQLMKKIVPHLSLEESKDIIDKLKKTRPLLLWQESQLRALRPKIVAAINREKNIKSLPTSIIGYSIIGIMLIVSCIISILNPPSPVSVKPELHIAVGMDSSMAVARMRDYAKQYGGDVYCQTHVGYSCSYTSPYGEKTSIAIRAELTGIGQSPVKGTVTSVNKSWDN